MTMTNFDSFEKQGLDKTETDFFKNMETMNKCFKTRLNLKVVNMV